jgi:transposase
MEKIPHGKYTKEFREEAVKLITAKGHSIDDAAKRLSLHKSTLANWIKSFKAEKLGDIGKGYRTLSDTELEIARLRRELAEVKMARDIIKRQQRTLRRIPSEVRDDKSTAPTISSFWALQTIQSNPQWLLQMADSTTLCPAARGGAP